MPAHGTAQPYPDHGVSPEVERHRCGNDHGGVRCQLMAGHRPAHAAMTAARTFRRWNAGRSWDEQDVYRVSVPREVLPWCPTYPRVVGGG